MIRLFWLLILCTLSPIVALAATQSVSNDEIARASRHPSPPRPFQISGIYGYGTTPTPAPTPTMSFSPTSLSLVLNGPLATVTGTDLNYTGQVTATSGNTNIATVSPASAPAPGPMTFTVTGVGAGSTTVTITDGTRSVPVSVTVSSPTSYAQTVLNDSPCAFYRLADVPISNPLFSSPMIDSSTNANNGTYAPGVMQATGIVANDMSSTSMRIPGGTWNNANQAYGPSNIAVQKPTTGVQFEVWASPETMQASVLTDRGGITGQGSTPSFVQVYTYNGSPTSGETSSTITLGTAGTAGQAPAAGHYLVAVVQVSDNSTGPVITPPAGFTQFSGADINSQWVEQDVFQYVVPGGGAPASLTFNWSTASIAHIWVYEVSQTAGIDIVTTNTNPSANSPWTTSTGTGTQTGLNDFGITVFGNGDSILTPSALSGYTSAGTLGQHGNGGATFGDTGVSYYSNANLMNASVPAQTVTWNSGGTQPVLGEQILMKPAVTQQPSPFRISMDSSFHAVFSVNIGGTASTVTSTTVMAYHTIYHIVGTYTGASQYITINNSKEGTTAKSGAISGYDTLSGIAIGGVYNNDNASLQWGGYIADVALYCNSTLMSDARITAHYTAGTGAATPTPTPVPTPSPTPPPSCGSTPAPLTNGAEWNTSFTPYSCSSSPFNINIPASPQIATWSSAVINNQFANSNPWPIRSQEAGTFDSGYSFWYADTNAAHNMVQIHLNCTAQASPNGGCNTVDNGGYPSTIWVPTNFRMSPNSQQGDSIAAIIQCGADIAACTHGTEIDVYSFSPGSGINSGTGPNGNWRTNDTLTVNTAAVNCGDWSTGSGFLTNFGATAGFNCAAGGMQHANEYIAGTINHSLKLILECQGQNGVNGVVYPVPASGATAHCGSQPNGGPPLGGLLWYDVPDSQTDANPNLKPWERAILKALHDHGGYFLDNSCPNGDGAGACTFATGIRQIFEGGAMFYYSGVTSPFAGLVPQGWVNNGILPGEFDNRYTGADPWNPFGFTAAYWKAHFHYLDPCEAHNPRTC